MNDRIILWAIVIGYMLFIFVKGAVSYTHLTLPTN